MKKSTIFFCNRIIQLGVLCQQIQCRLFGIIQSYTVSCGTFGYFCQIRQVIKREIGQRQNSVCEHQRRDMDRI